MSWLDRLPHQIPFRAASAVRRVDERTIEGVFTCTVNDGVPTGVMLLEAMAQFGGGLVFEGAGFLTGVDLCEVSREIVPGDQVVCTVVLEAEFGGTYRFTGTGSLDGVEIARGRFYLASSSHAQT